jgi:hypothetical protein
LTIDDRGNSAPVTDFEDDCGDASRGRIRTLSRAPADSFRFEIDVQQLRM